MQGRHIGKFGIGIASVLLISRWMSANAMFTASEATFTYGIIAGPLFALMGALSFVVFGWIGQKVRMHKQEAYSIIDLLHEQLDSSTKRWLFLFIGAGYGLDFLLLAMGASIIFYASVGLPPTLGVLLFMGIGFPLLFLKKYKDYGKYIFYKIGLFHSVIIIIVVYLFVSSNFDDMYFRMRLFHPYLFSIQKQELITFTIAVFFIFLGKLVTDLGAWNILFQIKKGKVRQSLLLSGLFWGTIPLSFSILTFPVLFQGGFKNIYTLFYDLLYSFQSDVLLLLTAITILMTLVTTYYTRLHEFLQLFEREMLTKHTKLVPLLTIITLAFLYGAYYILKPDLIQLFFFVGVLNTSLLIPFLSLIYTKKKYNGQMILSSIVTSIILGYITYFHFDIHISVFVPIVTSLVVHLTYYRFRNSN